MIKLIFKHIKKLIKYFFIYFFLYTKMTNRLQKVAHERYQNLSEEEKEKKHQYGHERYKNLISTLGSSIEYNKIS